MGKKDGRNGEGASGVRQRVTWKKQLSYAVLYGGAFFVPSFVMVVILRQGGFRPFGTKTLFIMDMQQQYVAFYAYMRYLIGGDNSVFFSWSRSMGGNFFGLFAYCLVSPLSLLVCLFPLKRMDLAILFLTVLKIGLCGVSFAGYAAYLWKRRVGEGRIPFLAAWMFSTCYALISYNIVYSLCPMWLDCVILLPVLLVGEEKILDGKKGFHYVLSLLAVIVCNYYVGYMVGIFAGVYFLYRAACRVTRGNVKECLGQGLRFGICTLLALGLSMPVLLPAVKSLVQGRLSGESGYQLSLETNFLFTDFLARFRNGVYDTITDPGLPSVYCGFAVLVLMAGLFSCRGISLREKVGAALMTVFMAASFYYKALNLAWHGFRPPLWFPYRYAFLFSFVMIHMAFLAFCAMWTESGRIRVKEGLLAAVFVLTILDLKINAQTLITGLEREFGYIGQAEYLTFLYRDKPLVDWIKEQDTGLYRVNEDYGFSKNDAMLLGFNGMTHYSSMHNAAVNSLTPKLGIAQGHFWNSGYGASPVMESLFAISYKLSDGEEPAVYEKLFDGGQGKAVYRNPMALPMVYAADVAALDPPLGGQEESFRNQNLFLNAIAGGQESYFRELEYSYEELESGWSYTLTAESEDPLYLYMTPGGWGWVEVYANDVHRGGYFSSETICCLYLGSYAPGEKVTVWLDRTVGDARNAKTAAIAELDMEALQATLDRLRAGGMEITEHGGGTLSGTISLREGQTVMTSIPYDEGWTVRVDGKKVSPVKFADTFLAFAAPAGEHELSLVYVSPGFATGVGIFLATVATVVVFFYAGRILRDRKK